MINTSYFYTTFATLVYCLFLLMPKLIDYPRTSYTGAWEVAEVVDDTGGKCALETCARKLNRKVSGSFKAIVGSAVKFGLLTSKREILTTTTLFRRIKHAYDKQEELLFHREAFLAPPLFTQLCRKFRSRELPVAMLDVLLIREFEVEEINAQSVAKAFIDGAHMVGILNEHNIIADIDQLAAQQPPRRELASPTPSTNTFRQVPPAATPALDADTDAGAEDPGVPVAPTATPLSSYSSRSMPLPATRPAPAATSDAIASLFGLGGPSRPSGTPEAATEAAASVVTAPLSPATPTSPSLPAATPNSTGADDRVFRIQLAGPGINTQLEVVDVEDLALVRGLLDKIERRLKQSAT